MSFNRWHHHTPADVDQDDGPTETELLKLKKDELITRATDAGATLNGDETKADLVAAILA